MAATATSQRNRPRLDAPQIGEGLWSVFDAQGCCIVQFSTAAGDVNGLRAFTAVAGTGPTLSVQGPAADINLNLAGQGAGFVVIVGPLEVTGAVTLDSTLHVVGAVTLDNTLEVKLATTLDSTLLVKDAATFQKALTQSGGTASFDSPTLVVNETNHLVGIGLVPAATGAKLDVTNGYIRALNGTNTPPTAGVGIELVTTSNIGFIAAVDRAGPTSVELRIDSAPLKLNTTGGAVTIGGATTINSTLHVTGAGTFDSSLAVGAGLSVTGNITLSGILIFTAATSQIIPGTTSFIITNNAQTQNNLQILNSGATTIQGGLTVTTGGVTVTAGGITITAGDLTLANAQFKRGTDTWLLPTGLSSDTLVTLTAVQTLQSKTLGAGTKVAIGSDATGDLYYNGGSGTLTRIAIGASTTVLVGGSSPGWAQVDRTRVVLTTATGIMTLHDAQTKDAAQTFTAQVVAGTSGTGAHQLVVASSAPSGATFTSSQLGIYGTTSTNLMLREMTDSVETYWLANSSGVNFGALTNHPLMLVTQNATRITIAAAGDVTVANNLIVTGDITGGTVAWKGLKAATTGQASIDSATTAVNTGGLTAPQMNVWAAGNAGPTSININKWLKVNVGTSSFFIPLFV